MDRYARKSNASDLSRGFKVAEIKLLNTLENLVANLGTMKDKRTHSRFRSKKQPTEELNDMYRSDWISRKVIDAPVDDMTRKWRTFNSSELQPNQIKELEKREKFFKVKKRFNEALKWGELHGGSLIYMGVDGTGRPDKPLRMDTIKKGSLKFINVIEKDAIKPVDVELNDPTAPNYKRPTYYENAKRDKIHFSRVLQFDGSLTPFALYKDNDYWHQSFLTAGWDAVINSQSFADIIISLAFETKVDVVHVEGLMSQLSKANGAAELQQRFGLADTLKSLNNMLLLDAKEQHTRTQTNFSGLEGLLKVYLSIVSAAFDIPANRLLGTSAPGLNDTGESDRSNYFDMIEAKQESKMGDNLTYFDEVFLRSELGWVPGDWESEFVSLWQVSKAAQATIELQNAQRDQLYRGIIPRSVMVKELKENGTYQFIDDDLIKDLEEIEGLEQEGEFEGDKNDEGTDEATADTSPDGVDSDSLMKQNDSQDQTDVNHGENQEAS